MKNYYASSFKEYLLIRENLKINEDDGDSGATGKEILSAVKIASSFTNEFYSGLSDEVKSSLPKEVKTKIGGEDGEEGGLKAAVQKWLKARERYFEDYYEVKKEDEIVLKIEPEDKKYTAIPLELNGKKIMPSSGGSGDLWYAYALYGMNGDSSVNNYIEDATTKIDKDKVKEMILNPPDGKHWCLKKGDNIINYYDFKDTNTYFYGIFGADKGVMEGDKWALGGGESYGGKNYPSYISIKIPKKEIFLDLVYNPIFKKFQALSMVNNGQKHKIFYGDKDTTYSLSLTNDSESGFKKSDYVTIESLASLFTGEPKSLDLLRIAEELPLLGKSSSLKGPEYLIKMLKTGGSPIRELSTIVNGLSFVKSQGNQEGINTNELKKIEEAVDPYISAYTEKILPLISFNGETFVVKDQEEEGASSDALAQNMNSLLGLIFTNQPTGKFSDNFRFKEFLGSPDRYLLGIDSETKKVKSLYDDNGVNGPNDAGIVWTYGRENSDGLYDGKIAFYPDMTFESSLTFDKYKSINSMGEDPWPYHSIEGTWKQTGSNVQLQGKQFKVGEKTTQGGKVDQIYSGLISNFYVVGKVSSDFKKITFPAVAGTNFAGEYKGYEQMYA